MQRVEIRRDRVRLTILISKPRAVRGRRGGGSRCRPDANVDTHGGHTRARHPRSHNRRSTIRGHAIAAFALPFTFLRSTRTKGLRDVRRKCALPLCLPPRLVPALRVRPMRAPFAPAFDRGGRGGAGDDGGAVDAREKVTFGCRTGCAEDVSHRTLNFSPAHEPVCGFQAKRG